MNRPSILISLLLSFLAWAAVAQTPGEMETLRSSAHLISGTATDYNDLIESTAGKRFVLIGEASHGSAEFYRERSRITQRLVTERGVRGVALEANWSDVRKLDRYISGEAIEQTDAFSEFTEFPQWMWKNSEFASFVRTLRSYNAAVAPEDRVHIFGMDLYGVHESADAVISFLRDTNPAAAAVASQRYACFGGYDMDAYRGGCENAAVAEFNDIKGMYEAARPDDRLFNALQDARVVMNGEAYFRGSDSTWNIRDTHMADTLAAIAEHYDVKLAVWAHNTHVGDARATDSTFMGQINVGQLIRERFPKQSLHIGFTTFAGTVMAASAWGQPGEVRTLNPAMPGSDAALFHATGISSFYVFTDEPELEDVLSMTRYQRAVGVLYLPESELFSHYFMARLAGQFDVVIHIDETRAVTPEITNVLPRRRAA